MKAFDWENMHTLYMMRESVSAKYVSLPDMSDVCLTFTMQFYHGLHSIARQMSDVSLPHFADTGEYAYILYIVILE